MSEVKLLPCPFCGLDVTDDEGCFPLNRERTRWEVRCGNPSCYAHEPADDSHESAAQRWNTRANLAEMEREVEVLRLRDAQQQGQAVAPYAYMQDCDLAEVTLLKAKGRPAVFSCLTWKTDNATIPIYTAQPPSVPEGWVLVPREPTPGMLEDFWMVANGQHPMDYRRVGLTKRQMARAKAAYVRMLAAAPSAQEVEVCNCPSHASSNVWPYCPVHYTQESPHV